MPAIALVASTALLVAAGPATAHQGGRQATLVVASTSPYGDGRDGFLTVFSGNTTYTDDVRTDLTADASSGATSITVDSVTNLWRRPASSGSPGSGRQD